MIIDGAMKRPISENAQCLFCQCPAWEGSQSLAVQQSNEYQTNPHKCFHKSPENAVIGTKAPHPVETFPL